jgi:hypothetical protein
MAASASRVRLLYARLEYACTDHSAARACFYNSPLHGFRCETHAEQITDTKFAADPTRGGLEVSNVIKVTGLQFARTSPAGSGTRTQENATNTL